LPVTFDTWYTQPAFCRFLDQTLWLPYLGTLSSEEEVVLKSGRERLDEFARRLKQEHLEAVKLGQRPVFRPISIRYKGRKNTTIATVPPTAFTTLANSAWSSIIARQIWRTTPSSTFPTA
jgi:hypothetical protein